MNQTETIKKYYTKIYNLCLYKTKKQQSRSRKLYPEYIYDIDRKLGQAGRQRYICLASENNATYINEPIPQKKKKESLVQPITSCEDIQSDTADPSDLMISDEEIEEHKQKILSLSLLTQILSY